MAAAESDPAATGGGGEVAVFEDQLLVPSLGAADAAPVAAPAAEAEAGLDEALPPDVDVAAEEEIITVSEASLVWGPGKGDVL